MFPLLFKARAQSSAAARARLARPSDPLVHRSCRKLRATGPRKRRPGPPPCRGSARNPSRACAKFRERDRVAEAARCPVACAEQRLRSCGCG